MIFVVGINGFFALVCAIDRDFFVSLTKALIIRRRSSTHRCLPPFFQTLTEVRALRFPEVFSKNNVQEVSGRLLPSSGGKHKLLVNLENILL